MDPLPLPLMGYKEVKTSYSRSKIYVATATVQFN